MRVAARYGTPPCGMSVLPSDLFVLPVGECGESIVLRLLVRSDSESYGAWGR